jgi:hypothetical protein
MTNTPHTATRREPARHGARQAHPRFPLSGRRGFRAVRFAGADYPTPREPLAPARLYSSPRRASKGSRRGLARKGSAAPSCRKNWWLRLLGNTPRKIAGPTLVSDRTQQGYAVPTAGCESRHTAPGRSSGMTEDTHGGHARE